ncbi:MAG TPA: ABC transporter substrate-binding protein, partial [Candidatus Binatia bacterium]|nr:ABC transporter substrate-binding protein [Candidatus Binatia bacterium]
MNQKVLVSLLGAAALAAAACGSTSSTPSSSASVPASQSASAAPTTTVGPPLIEEGTTGVTFSDDFNPYDPKAMAPGMNMRSLVWEPLYEMDALDPNQNNPWLATGYAFSNNGSTLAVTVRSNVKFNDGSAMTPADVAATFKLMETSAADTPGVPAQASDPTVSGQTVTLTFKSPAYTSLWEILGSTYILPAAMAQEIAANPTTVITHDKAVGTGPFVPTSYSTSVVKFTPNKNYWDGTPPESEVDVPSIQSNTTVVTDLTANPPQLDWAGNDIPNVYSDYVDLNPETNHAWFASGNTVVLWFNLNAGNGGATGIGDPKVRKA